MYYCRMGFTCEYLLIANCEFSLCLQLDYLLTSRRRTTVGPHSEQGIHAMQVKLHACTPDTCKRNSQEAHGILSIYHT